MRLISVAHFRILWDHADVIKNLSGPTIKLVYSQAPGRRLLVLFRYEVVCTHLHANITPSVYTDVRLVSPLVEAEVSKYIRCDSWGLNLRCLLSKAPSK